MNRRWGIPGNPWDVEKAREAGRKGGKASAAKRAERARERELLRKDELARRVFEDKAEEMAKVIVEAALGQGAFARLSPKERAQFALKALEYGVGRPRTQDPSPPEQTSEGQGLAFVVPDPEL